MGIQKRGIPAIAAIMMGWLKKSEPKVVVTEEAQPKAETAPKAAPKAVEEKSVVDKENLVNAATSKDAAVELPKKPETATKSQQPTESAKPAKRVAESSASSKETRKKVKTEAPKGDQPQTKQTEDKQTQLSRLLDKAAFAGTVTPRLMCALKTLGGHQATDTIVECVTQLVQNANTMMAGKNSEVQLQEKIATFDLSKAKMLTSSALSGVSLLCPRGKFDVFWCESVACFRGKSTNCVVHYDNIKHMFQLPMSPVEKKTLIVLVLLTPVPYMKQMLQQVVISVPDADKRSVDKPTSPLPDSMTGTLKAVLCEGFTTLCGKPATGPSQKTYHNASGGLALKAYLKVQDGLLFFFRVGLCFTKPYTFVNASEIEAYEIEPTGRTFEINLLLKSGKKVDFSMIDSAEYEGVAKYFKKMTAKGLICLTPASDEEQLPEAAANNTKGEPEGTQEQEGNSCSETESESDDEYNPEEPSSDDEGAKDGDESSEEEDGEEEEEEDRSKKVSKK